MTFIWPAMLVLLSLIPAFVAGYLFMLQRRREKAAQYANPALVRQTGGSNLRGRRHVPPILFLIALAVLIIALARPQTVLSLPRIEGTVILAFDVSASMAGDDMKPSRLEAAKAAALDFVERQPPSVQIGVVSFSDSGFSTQAPTNDQGAIAAAINRLSLQGGTSLARGIESSLKTIDAVLNPPLSLSTRPQGDAAPTPTPVPKGTHPPAVIVLLTDGENTSQPDPIEMAQTAADRGVRIYTVGVGSASGATLNIDGYSIRSHLDEATLQQISQITDGTYYNAQTEQDLQAIYDNLNPQLVLKDQKVEVTSLMAGVGLVFLMIGGALSLLWLGRVP